MSSYDEHLISMAGGDEEDDFPCCAPVARPDQLEAIGARASDPFGTLKLGIGQVDADRDALLEIVREQRAAIGRVEALAAAWEARGESDMAFSKSVRDEHIAVALLTSGADMVENARHIRAALTATEGAA